MPKPVLHIAGTSDPLVKFTWQERALLWLRKLNGCGEGLPCAADPSCMLYSSWKGAPLVTWVHSGGNSYPDEAPGLIVRFFKENQLP